MLLHKFTALVATIVALTVVVGASVESQVNDLQAEETRITHTRQKRSPLLLKKLLFGGLLAKKAILVGGGAGLIGAGVGSVLASKYRSKSEGPYRVYGPPPLPPSGSGYPVYFDAPVPVRPPVYYDQYPAVSAPRPPSPQYGVPVYVTSFQPRPPPPLLPPLAADCYQGSQSNVASASSSSYA